MAEFVRDIKKLDRDLGKAARLAFNTAAELVVGVAKSGVPSGPPAGGHAVSSIKARSTQTQGRVTGGGPRYPYYPWLDFGGSVGRNNSVHRPFIKTGRYIWAAYADNRPAVEKQLAMALTEVAAAAGLAPSP